MSSKVSPQQFINLPFNSFPQDEIRATLGPESKSSKSLASIMGQVRQECHEQIQRAKSIPVRQLPSTQVGHSEESFLWKRLSTDEEAGVKGRGCSVIWGCVPYTNLGANAEEHSAKATTYTMRTPERVPSLTLRRNDP